MHLPPVDHRAAATFLASIDDDWARAIATIGTCRHEPKPAREPYEALIRAIAYQQLHAKAGDAILSRLQALYSGQFPSPEQILGTDFDAMRACGFSVRKGETIKGIAEAALKGVVPNRAQALKLSDDEMVRRLAALKGIGRWTVEMFLIYTMARPDILPADDFGVREGYRRLKALEVALTPKVMQSAAERWSPYRTVATWYLWRIQSNALAQR